MLSELLKRYKSKKKICVHLPRKTERYCYKNLNYILRIILQTIGSSGDQSKLLFKSRLKCFNYRVNDGQFPNILQQFNVLPTFEKKLYVIRGKLLPCKYFFLDTGRKLKVLCTFTLSLHYASRKATCHILTFWKNSYFANKWWSVWTNFFRNLNVL